MSKVCTVCGDPAWMYTSKQQHPESKQAGEYRCWQWMMHGTHKIL